MRRVPAPFQTRGVRSPATRRWTMVTVLSKTGAQVIIDRLLCEGVSFAFGLCGHGNIGLLDALYDVQGEIRTISVHHEQAAGHMADAYWRVTHRPAVTFTSCGPGSTNIPVAIASAMMDSSALLAITANVPSVQFNRGAFQETYRHYQADFPSVLRPYVKRSFQPTRPDQLPLVMRQAFQVMLGGRPGPVQVDVPLDLFVETVEVGGERPQAVGDSVRIRSAAEAGQLEAALTMLIGATRPVILAGGGAVLSEAEADVRALAERLGIPVVSTPLASGALSVDHPLYFGNVGRNGTYAANEATRNADVILALGVRFDDRMSSSWIPGYTFEIPPTKLIQVDIDPAEIGRNYPV
ncbi:MAG: thiamine pyrophosphate-binding protein, partial [Bacillati bacterium ANGP1]